MLSMCYVKSIDFEQQTKACEGQCSKHPAWINKPLGIISPLQTRTPKKQILKKEEGEGGKAPSPSSHTFNTYFHVVAASVLYIICWTSAQDVDHSITPLQLLNSNVQIFHISAQLFYVKLQLLFVTPNIFNMQIWPSSLKQKPFYVNLQIGYNCIAFP